MFLLNDSTHRMLMRFDPGIGHRYVSNLVARIPHETGGYLVRTNSSGFRSDIEFTECRGDRPRILAFGDSFTAGEGCSSQERYPELLGEAFGAEVYNYGLSGSAPDQHLLCYREFAKNVQADLIIWGIPLHNIERIKLTHRPSKDRVTGGSILIPKPYFTIEQGSLKLHHVPVPRLRPEPLLDNNRQYTENASWNPPIMERFLTSSMLEGLRSVAQHAMPGFKEHARALAYRLSKTQHYEDYLTEKSTGWTLLAALIRQFRVEVKDIPILIVPLPTYHYYIDRLDPVYDDLYRTLEEPTNGLLVSTITNALHEGKTLVERKAMCFETDTHYSPFGHHEIARLLAMEIRSKNLLPEKLIPKARSVTITDEKRNTSKYVLGLVFGQGEGAAALVRDGMILAVAEENSFSGDTMPGQFPLLAVNYCLEEAGINQDDLSAIVYGCELSSLLELDIQRLFSTTSAEIWRRQMSDWILRELNVYPVIRRRLNYEGPLLESSSFASQCASAFYSSPYPTAAVVNLGEALQSQGITIGHGSERGLKLLKKYSLTDTLETFEATMVRFMASTTTDINLPLWQLARGGEASFSQEIFTNLLDLKEDGSIELNPEYFAEDINWVSTALRLESLFGITRSVLEGSDRQRANLAKSTQLVICKVILQIAKFARKLSGLENLCVSGSLVGNPDVQEALVQADIFDNIWFQSTNGNAGTALGAALLASFDYLGANRDADQLERLSQSGALFGPEFSEQEIEAFLDTYEISSKKYCPEIRASQIARLITQGKVIGYFCGRLAVGTQCIGDRMILRKFNRSESEPTIAILSGAHFPNDFTTWSKVISGALSSKQKYETQDTNENHLQASDKSVNPDADKVWARVIREAVSPGIYNIIKCVEDLTGCNLVATSKFELHPGSTVCTPLDAYRVFMQSNMDALVLGEHVLLKEDQPIWPQPSKAISDGKSRAREAVPKELMGALTQLYNRKFLPTKVGSRTLNTADFSSKYHRPLILSSKNWEMHTKKLVSDIPLELDRGKIRHNLLARVLGRRFKVGPMQSQFHGILKEMVRLNNRFYTG